jgi:antitoxin HicB
MRFMVDASCYSLLRGHNRNMAKQKKLLSYQISLIPEKSGGYTVLVATLPGCVSYGSTIEEATLNAREAIELHLENLAAHKEHIPEDNETMPVFTTLVQVTPTYV